LLLDEERRVFQYGMKREDGHSSEIHMKQSTSRLLGGCPGKEAKIAVLTVRHTYEFQPVEGALKIHRVCPRQDIHNLMKINDHLRARVKGAQTFKLHSMILEVRVPHDVPFKSLTYHWELLFLSGGGATVRPYPIIDLIKTGKKTSEHYVVKIPFDPSFMTYGDKTRIMTCDDASTYPVIFLKTEGREMDNLLVEKRLHYQAKVEIEIWEREPNVGLMTWLHDDEVVHQRNPNSNSSVKNLSSAIVPKKIVVTIDKEIEEVMTYQVPYFDPKSSKRNWKIEWQAPVRELIRLHQCVNCKIDFLWSDKSGPYLQYNCLLCEHCVCVLEHSLYHTQLNAPDHVRCQKCSNYFTQLFGTFRYCYSCVQGILPVVSPAPLNCLGCERPLQTLKVSAEEQGMLRPLCEKCEDKWKNSFQWQYCLYCAVKLTKGKGTTVCVNCTEYLSSAGVISGNCITECFICEKSASEEFGGILYCSICWDIKIAALWKYRKKN